MKIFENYKAQRRFADLYEMLDEQDKSKFADAIRKQADEKVHSIDDNLQSFYMNVEDVDKCFQQIANA